MVHARVDGSLEKELLTFTSDLQKDHSIRIADSRSVSASGLISGDMAITQADITSLVYLCRSLVLSSGFKFSDHSHIS